MVAQFNCLAVREAQAVSCTETPRRTSRTLPKLRRNPVSVIVVCPACPVFHPTEDISHGRPVMAPQRASGLACRMSAWLGAFGLTYGSG